MGEPDMRRGKMQLTEAKYGIDLSGRDLENIFLDVGQSLSHSFLNGASLRESAFLGGPIDQTELAEAEIIGCLFRNTDFTGSSFIGSKVNHTAFQNCNFSDGEWRKSTFSDVHFVGCNFNYTTINLCVFDNCTFNGEGARHLDNRSVNYNVFTRTKFDFFVKDDVVLASNFGFPREGSAHAVTGHGAGITLNEICLRSASGRVVISELVDAIQNEFRQTSGHRLKLLRLEFVSNIVVALSKNSHISSTSLVYLESFFSSLARSATNEFNALAAMSILLNIRNAIFDQSESFSSEQTASSQSCSQIDIRYGRTYTESDAIELAKILGELANNNAETFAVSRFATGSTIIVLVAVFAVSAGATLKAINYALKQANVTLIEARELRMNAMELVAPSPKSSSKRRRKRQSRVPALQRSGAPTTDMLILRKTVSAHGYEAVRLDDVAEATIYFSSSK